MGDGLGKALDGPFTGTVEAEQRHAALATDAGDVLDEPTLRRLTVAHDLHGGARDVDQAEEVDLHLLPDLLVGILLKAAREAVAGVVDDDVDALEFRQCRRKGLLDRLPVRHVQSHREEIVRCRSLEFQCRGVARRRHDVVASVEHFLRVEVSKPRRRARDEEYSRHNGWMD